MLSKNFCQWCGNQTDMMWVHGHGQCSICGINSQECCNGEACQL